MSEIEQKALALVNEVRAEWGGNWAPRTKPFSHEAFKALCRAIEQHEAFRRDVSDAVVFALKVYGGHRTALDPLRRFIIAKPDPLAEAWIEATGNTVGMEPLNAALAARGLEIVKKEPSQ